MNFKRFSLFILVFLTGCVSVCISACTSRQASAPGTIDSDIIEIGVAYPVAANDSTTYLHAGIDLAVDQINEAGGILGKPLQIRLRDDQNDQSEAARIAQAFADNNITAVIGHWSSNINYMVEDIYEENGVLLVMPCAASTDLFDYDYNYIFRMFSNSIKDADALAAGLNAKGLKRVAICYSDDTYGIDFAEQAERSLSRYNIVVVDRITGLTAASAAQISDRWQAFGCEAVITSHVAPQVYDTISQIRSMEADYPIFGTDNFQRSDFAARLGGDVSNLYRTENDPLALSSEYLERFNDTYGHDPDIYATAGYASVYLIRDAMEACQSTDAAVLASYLKQLQDYPAVTGILSYNSETSEFDGSRIHVVPMQEKNTTKAGEAIE